MLGVVGPFVGDGELLVELPRLLLHLFTFQDCPHQGRKGQSTIQIGIYRKDGTENVCSCLRYAGQSHRRTAVRRQRGFKEMVSCPLFRFNRSLFLILIIIKYLVLFSKNVCMTSSSSSSPPPIHPSTSLIAENVLLTSPKDLLSLSLSLAFFHIDHIYFFGG